MTSGIRATVRFDAVEDCPVVQRATAADAVVDRTATSVAPSPATESVTEFLLEETDADASADSQAVFSYGSATVHRARHGVDATCPCVCLGEFGCPIHRYVAGEGGLTLVFHAESFDQLQAVMAEFRERYDHVDVQRLLQPPLEGSPEERVFVNRGRLTDRQLEVLRTAYERGYFERPRRVNATEVAAELGISQSTFAEHLAAAQQKLFEDVLEGT
jgi:predicted DNA binding protein